MPERHVDDLFSPAYDGQLNDTERRRFDAHLHECARCRSDYEHFHASVDTVRALPAARMPIPVHLPSTPPIGELRAAWRHRWTRLLRYRTGMATGLAAAAAVAIVAVALTHQGAQVGSRSASPAAGSGALGQEPYGAAGSSATAGCPRPAAGSPAAPPADLSHRSLATQAARPGQRLVLAASSGEVAPGTTMQVYAVLTAPRAELGIAPSSQPAASITAVPCLVVVEPLVKTAQSPATAVSNLSLIPEASGAPLGLPRSQQTEAPLFSVDVPAGTPAGTVLHITATVPAGYPDPADPPMTAALTVVVR